LKHHGGPLVDGSSITYDQIAVNVFIGKCRKMVGKTPSLGIRVRPETKAALEKAATDDFRSVSSLVEKILVEWLRKKGYLKQ
jgi:hypothetical protein